MTDNLELRRGGKLFASEWDGETGDYVVQDVTERAPMYLFWPNCTIEEGVTLGDLFTLIKLHLPFFSVAINNWVEEYISEAYSQPAKKIDVYDPEGIEYLELSWYIEFDRGGTRVSTWGKKKREYEAEPYASGYSFPQLSGVGWELREDLDQGHGNVYEAGHRINWGVGFTPAYELVDLPIRLNPRFRVFDDSIPIEESNGDPNWREVVNCGGATFTLGHILYGTIWELTWHGPPESRDERKADLDERMKEIDEGTANLVSFESIEDFFDQVLGDLDE
jgi:hypothetical protein